MKSALISVILLDFLEPGQTINSDRYVPTLTKLKVRISRTSFLLKHDNARPRTNINTMEHVADFGWTVLPDPQQRSDSAPCESHLFGPMKNGLHGQYFPDNDAVMAAVRKWVASASADFNESSMQAFVHRCRKCITSCSDYLNEFHS
jgi:hypothetical protein